MRWVSKACGTNLEQASPASAPAGTELEGPAYSRRHSARGTGRDAGDAEQDSGRDAEQDSVPDALRES